MKNQFADYETSKQLKELGFDEQCLACYNSVNKFIFFDDAFVNESNSTLNENNQFHCAPLWQQAKQWLWENKMIIVIKQGISGFYSVASDFGNLKIVSKDYPSPITAEIEGIKAAINHLHKQL